MATSSSPSRSDDEEKAARDDDADISDSIEDMDFDPSLQRITSTNTSQLKAITRIYTKMLCEHLTIND